MYKGPRSIFEMNPGTTRPSAGGRYALGGYSVVLPFGGEDQSMSGNPFS